MEVKIRAHLVQKTAKTMLGILSQYSFKNCMSQHDLKRMQEDLDVISSKYRSPDALALKLIEIAMYSFKITLGISSARCSTHKMTVEGHHVWCDSLEFDVKIDG